MALEGDLQGAKIKENGEEEDSTLRSRPRVDDDDDDNDDEDEEEETDDDNKVMKIINEASQNGRDRIDLSGLQIKFLPEAIGKRHHLVVLNLSNNQLEVICKKNR